MNKFKDSSAVSVITCNRQDMLVKALSSIDEKCVDIFVVNAGDPLTLTEDELKDLGVKEVINSPNPPEYVGRAKNRGLRKMRHDGYEYLFLMEDDVLIKNNGVFQRYIETAADSGLWAGQLSYGRHGGERGGNVTKDGQSKIIDNVKYDKFGVDLYPNSFQAFTLYHANTIRLIGYMDELYRNAAEHLDHYFSAFKIGLGNYFWYFPDIENSKDFIEDIDENHERSVIRAREDWKVNMKYSWNLFKTKHKLFPTEIPRAPLDKVIERLSFIEEHYSQKKLIDIHANCE